MSTLPAVNILRYAFDLDCVAFAARAVFAAGAADYASFAACGHYSGLHGVEVGHSGANPVIYTVGMIWEFDFFKAFNPLLN
jgi:hypothetical protein